MFDVMVIAAAITAAIPTASAAEELQIKAQDGVTLHATAAAVPGSKRGVVLVPMEGRSSEDWKYLEDRLTRSQTSAIAIDLRGQGKNPPKALSDADYKAMVQDVAAGVAWLRKQGATEISCAGASLGANLCLQAAVRDPQIVNAVLLSPGMNIKGITAGDAIVAYGDRPVLIVASAEDATARVAATALETTALGQKHLVMLQNAGRGTKMLNQDANLEGLVLSWLLGTYQLSSGEIVHPKPAQADLGTVETEGKKLPSHQ